MSKDHFVPRHYLRQFAIHGTTEMVAAARICPYIFLGTKAIRGQCQQVDFEEGDKKLSELLKITENDLAPILAAVVKKKNFTEPELLGLRWLVATLHVRTRKAAESHKDFQKRIFYEVIKDAIEMGKLPLPPEGTWTEEMVDCKGMPGFLMNNVIPCALEMQTLACKILEASGENFFITSDNPVAVLNQFCARAESNRSHAGFSKSGFQLLLPISPKLCLFFYDAKIYKAGSRRHRLTAISTEDVEIVNSLQIQSAENSVYFHKTEMEGEIKRLISLYVQLRVPVDSSLRILPGPTPEDEILHFRQLSVKLPRTWRFCNLRRHINYGVGDRRNPAWTALISELMNDFEKNPDGGDIQTRFQKILGDPNSLKGVHVS